MTALHRSRSRHRWSYFAIVALGLSACTQTERCRDDSADAPAARVAGADSAGSRVRVDTVIRIDTVMLIDTVVALGRAEAADEPPRRGQDVTPEDLAYLRSRKLIVPVAGISAAKIPSSFDEMRGARRHNALDILAPRGTPVLSADDGTVAKIDTSDGGGLSLYIAGPRDRFIFYYAHLDAYRRGIAEGMRVGKGDTIGYVGTTGNAPPNTPHLHFAIALADEDKRWWKGTPLDPLPLLRLAEDPSKGPVAIGERGSILQRPARIRHP
jgi:murein DD-endopeptidase MepM/ murein hydrolase activator NlpD